MYIAVSNCGLSDLEYQIQSKSQSQEVESSTGSTTLILEEYCLKSKCRWGGKIHERYGPAGSTRQGFLAVLWRSGGKN